MKHAVNQDEQVLTTRRSILKAGGGLVVAFTLPFATQREASAAGSFHSPNAFVHIADSGAITLTCNASEMGQGVSTALPMLLAEELEVDPRKVKVVFAPIKEVYANPIFQAQLTGGSATVRANYQPLLKAGAQAREMLLAAAAAKWSVDAATLKATDGAVVGQRGKKATYGELAAAAAALTAPTEPKLKDPKEYRFVGKAMKRLDTPAKVDGTAVFGIDVKLPGMLYAAIILPPAVGGKVRSFDGSGAKKLPGVVDVVSTDDGVAVVADTWWRAQKARGAVAVQWDDGPSGKTSTEDIRQTFLKAFDQGTAIEVAPKVGDVDAALRGAARVHKAEFWMQSLAHATMEPMNFTATYMDSACHLIGPTQFQAGLRGFVAGALGIKPENVTCETTFLGGGFGRRVELDVPVQAAKIAKQLPGRPVKLLWTREDDTTHDFYRPISVIRVEVGVDAKGMPAGIRYRLSSQSIGMRDFGMDPKKLDPFMVEYAVTPYRFPASQYEAFNTDAGIRVGWWRSVSHAANCVANEALVDELAALSGQDPLAYRLALLDPAGRPANVLRVAARKAGWDTPVPAGRSRGIALLEAYDGFHALVSEVSVQGTAIEVNRIFVASDVGRMINPDIVRAQIQSSVVFGLGAALMQEITFDRGRVTQKNFDSFPLLRMNQHPAVIDITLVESAEKPAGIGEPVTAVVQAATVNAVSKALNRRVRQLPMTPEALSRV